MKTLINIDVPHLAAAISFYTRALGLELARLLDDDVAELRDASAIIYLLEKPPGSTIAKTSAGTRDYSRHWTPVHLDFVVEDLGAATQRALDAGAVRESECVEWKGSRCVTFSDPFGHGFCLIAFEEESYAGDNNPLK